MKEKKKKTKRPIAGMIFVVLLLLDQITKILAIYHQVEWSIIPEVLDFCLVCNPGIAFGIGQGGNIAMFIISNLIVLGIILHFLYMQKERMDEITKIGLIMVLAGGTGNVMDRIFRGEVVDFIRVFPSTHFPVFNIADIYIVIGWIVVAFMFAKYSYQEIRLKKQEKESK